jgi:iron complex transport system ATP-binding protein
MSEIRLDVEGLAVEIGGQTLVRDLGFQLAAGERLAILGRNGAGKTTLLHSLAGLRAPSAGRIGLCGDDLHGLTPTQIAQRRGLLLQHQLDAFPASVLETALIGRHPWLGRWTWESRADEAMARDALRAVGLESFALRDVHTLSGGERQRLAIATLLTQAPQLALLDEPLSHLDLNHQVAVLDLFSHRVREAGLAVVMVLHDINLALRHSDRALLLFGDGRHVIGPVAEVMQAELLTQLYGHPLRELADGERRYLVPG